IIVRYTCRMMREFFFSGRRRHTRSKRDWSSDVCSSDLAIRRAPDGVTVVSHDAFVQSRPVNRSVIVVARDRLDQARVVGFAAREIGRAACRESGVNAAGAASLAWTQERAGSVQLACLLC